MMRFAETFPGVEIVSTASRQLTRSHFIEFICLKNSLLRKLA